MRRIVLFAILLLPFYSYCQKGYQIRIHIAGLKDTPVFLQSCFGNYSAVNNIDTILLNTKGEGVFKGNTPLPTGLYLIKPSTREFFDIILENDQEFSIETDTADLFGHLKFTGSPENESYFKYQNYVSKRNMEINELQSKKSAATDPLKIDQEIGVIYKEISKYQIDFVSRHKTGFLGKYIKATMEVEVPEAPKNSSGVVIDPYFQYYYYRNHYLDNVDFSVPALVRTPILEHKIVTYMSKVVPQIPDTVIREIDKLIGKSRSNKEVFRFMLSTLFNFYLKGKTMGHEAAYLHIADKYYIKEAVWDNEGTREGLSKIVARKLPTSLGKIAPNLKLYAVDDEEFKIISTDVSKLRELNSSKPFYLSEIKADFVVLYFWAVDCDHCRTSIPKMHQAFERLKDRNVKVVAIQALTDEKGKEEWVKFINENMLYGWINAWSPNDFSYNKRYNIEGTPAIFLLDRNCKILAKNISTEKCEEIINSMINSPGKQ